MDMNNDFKPRSHSDPPSLEKLKWDQVESDLCLADSFARQSVRCAKEGDRDGVMKARQEFEHFLELALKTAQTMHKKMHSGGRLTE
jgi:hypothetical protein